MVWYTEAIFIRIDKRLALGIKHRGKRRYSKVRKSKFFGFQIVKDLVKSFCLQIV